MDGLTRIGETPLLKKFVKEASASVVTPAKLKFIDAGDRYPA